MATPTLIMFGQIVLAFHTHNKYMENKLQRISNRYDTIIATKEARRDELELEIGNLKEQKASEERLVRDYYEAVESKRKAEEILATIDITSI